MSRRIERRALARLFEVEERFVAELEERAIIEAGHDGRYDVVAVERVRVCCSMHHDLGVNMPGLEVALDLLERWQDERRRLTALVEELRRERDDVSKT